MGPHVTSPLPSPACFLTCQVGLVLAVQFLPIRGRGRVVVVLVGQTWVYIMTQNGGLDHSEPQFSHLQTGCTSSFLLGWL